MTTGCFHIPSPANSQGWRLTIQSTTAWIPSPGITMKSVWSIGWVPELLKISQVVSMYKQDSEPLNSESLVNLLLSWEQRMKT